VRRPDHAHARSRGTAAGRNHPGPGRFPARAGRVDRTGQRGHEPVYQAPLHEHPEDEAWYVLQGTLAVRAGEHVHQVSAGGAVIVPGRTAHTFWNPRPDPARYLLIMGADTFALIQAIHATDDRSPARMRQLYAAHGATLLD
jgi:mannose-6-phosphate isomerase-like protein (cupin superfamily)